MQESSLFSDMEICKVLSLSEAHCIFVTSRKLVSHWGNELSILSGWIIKMFIVAKSPIRYLLCEIELYKYFTEFQLKLV